MRSLNGWLGVGFGRDDGQLREFEGYSRSLFRSTDSPELGTWQGFTGPSEPFGKLITHAAVFDAQVAGHCLASFKLLPPFTEIPHGEPAMVAATTYLLMFELPVTMALNGTVMSGGTSDLPIERGQYIGRLNNQRVLAGCKLLIHAGQLVSRAGHVRKKEAA